MLQQQPSANSGLGFGPGYGQRNSGANDSLDELDNSLLNNQKSFGLASPQSNAASKSNIRTNQDPNASG